MEVVLKQFELTMPPNLESASRFSILPLSDRPLQIISASSLSASLKQFEGTYRRLVRLHPPGPLAK